MEKPVANNRRGRIENLKMWKPGQSGNPNGRPKKSKEIEAKAQESAEKALKKLVTLMNSDDERVALAAAQAVLDRGVGKPTQTVDSTVTNRRDVTDIDDAELAAIAKSGSAGTSAETDGAQESDQFH